MTNQPEKRKPIKQSLRFAVFKRDEFTCIYCGRKSPEVELEADHKFPHKKGGKDEIENLVTSCTDCNRGKGSGDITDTISATQSMVAKALGIDRRTLVEWIDGGHIVRMERGEYNVLDVAAQAIKYLRGRSSADALTQRKTELAAEQTRKIRLEIDERERRLLPMELFEAAWMKLASVFRTNGMAVPSSKASRFVGLKTIAQAEKRLREVMDELLKSISSADPRRIVGLDRAGFGKRKTP